MTATATLRRSRPSLAASLKRAPGEALVFAGATILALIHAFDDALVSRQPGVPSDRHALALSIALFLGVAAIAGFTRLRPGLRAGLAFAFGGLADGQRRHAHDPRRQPRRGRRRRDRRARRRGRTRARRPRRRNPVAPPRHVQLARACGRRAGDDRRHAVRRRPGRDGDRRGAQVARAGRRAAERGLSGRDVPVVRRARDRRLVPAVAQRRRDRRRARRRQRPQGLGGARRDARPPRLRRPALRLPRPR